MIIGVDVGYSTTKTNNGIIFESKISKADNISGCENIYIDGKSYSIGKGNGTVDVNKIDNEITKVCLYSALAMSEDNTFKVVTGLPISQYDTQADYLKEMIMQNKTANTIYNGMEKKIHIEDVKIYPQGAGALFAHNIQGNLILIDIGSRTVDIALFELNGRKRVLQQSKTLYCGTMNLYGKVIDETNKRFNLGLNSNYGEQIIRNDLIIDGDIQSKEYIKAICQSHLNELYNELDLNYPVRTTPMYLCGGGAYILGGFIKAKYKRVALLDNAQFSNAIGFKKVGELIWPE